jgi:predicted phosphoribosyltransferase
VKASAAITNERVKRERGEERREKGRRRLVKLTKTGSETGSTGFAAARTVNAQKTTFDCAENLAH